MRELIGHWRVRVLSKSPLKLMLGALVFFSMLLLLCAKQYLEANFARKTVTELQLRLRYIEEQAKADSEATDDLFKRVAGDVRGLNHYVQSLDENVKQNRLLRSKPGHISAFAANPVTFEPNNDAQVPLADDRLGQVAQAGDTGAVTSQQIITSPQGIRTILFPGVTVVIMFCFGRPNYLKKALESLTTNLREQATLQHSREDGALSAPNSFLVVLSQDGEQSGISRLLDEAIQVLISIDGVDALHLHHPRTPIIKKKTNAYFKLAEHFRWAFNKIFDIKNDDSEITSRLAGTPDRVIILEDDMLLAVDFFEYMGAMSVVLDRDPSVMAVSAWNDHGQAQFVNDNQALLRSDFFPGLGWMTTRSVWEQLEADWPRAYWDDWLREPEQRRDRQFILPQVSRTYTIGKAGGASKGQFFKKYLASIHLNDKFVAFTERDMASLETQTYHTKFNSRVESAVVIKYTAGMDLQAYQSTGVVITYAGAKAYEVLCKSLGVLSDVKAGMPRGSYEGILLINIQNTPVFLVSERPISKEEQQKADKEEEKAERKAKAAERRAAAAAAYNKKHGIKPGSTALGGSKVVSLPNISTFFFGKRTS